MAIVPPIGRQRRSARRCSAGLCDNPRAQMWSVPNLYLSSVTLSRSFFLSRTPSILLLPDGLCSWSCTRRRRHQKRVTDMYALLIILLVALPFGTAIACGALMQWAGNIISGWSSVGGMALGIYFFHKCMEVLSAT